MFYFRLFSNLWAWRFQSERYENEENTVRTEQMLTSSCHQPFLFFAPFSTREVLEGHLPSTRSHFKGTLVGLSEVNSNPP